MTTMKTQDGEQESFEGARAAIDQARTEVSKAVGHVPEIAGKARDRAENTVTRLQTMPDSALRLLAAVSLGLGAGLRLAGAPRLVTLAGFAPASILGFAILSRPRPSHQAAHPA